MANDEKPKPRIEIKVLDSGDVAVEVYQEERLLIGAKRSPQDFNTVIGKLIAVTNEALRKARKRGESPKGAMQPTLPIRQIDLISVPSATDEWTMVLHADEVELKFGAHDLRGTVRMFSAASISNVSKSISSIFGRIVSDLFFDLKTLRRVASLRVGRSARRRVVVFSNWITGRSLRMFRAVKVADGSPSPQYAPVGACIYCGETVYSYDMGVRSAPLGDEHIIAGGLGGTLILPQASCRSCENATGGIVERDVLARQLKAVRMYLKLGKKSAASLPKTLPLQKVLVSGREQQVEIAIEDYPVVLGFPVFDPPRLDGVGGKARIVRQLVIVEMQSKREELSDKYGITDFAYPHLDAFMLCRMLAKIGHAFAIAEVGRENFRPLLADFICKENDTVSTMIGSCPDSAIDPKSDALHELGLGYQRIGNKTYVVAKIRLFANQRAPVYLVIVGESLESSLARSTRRFLRKTSQ